MENRAAFLSGKLNGTKTLETVLSSIANPDKIEQFLKSFLNVSFDINTDNKVVYINDNQDFEEKIKYLENHDAISIHVNENFSRLYVTTEDKTTLVVRINKVSPSLINLFISKEKPVKYALNSFSFVKWCNSKSIDLRNVYDIPTYIKLLTNDVDPFMTVGDYIKKYTKQELLDDDNEYNSILIGNFICEFGKYLANFVEKFNLSNVCKLINENSYFEGNTFEEEGLCKIVFSYSDLLKHIEDIVKEKIVQYDNKAYLISPLGRIAIKYGRKPEELMIELYNDDIELMILNELFNNNIKVVLLEENLYEVTCKYKVFNNVITLLTAILNDVFFTMFQSKIDVKMECLVRE